MFFRWHTACTVNFHSADSSTWFQFKEKVIGVLCVMLWQVHPENDSQVKTEHIRMEESLVVLRRGELCGTIGQESLTK